MQKIFIEDGLTLYNKTGIGQYTENLALMLQDLGYDIIMPRKYFLEKIKNASVKRILYVLWLNLIFPFMLIFCGARKLIFANYLTPFYKILGIRYYPIIYDLSAVKYPETMGKVKSNYQKWILKVIKNTYYKIITDSNTANKEIIDFYKVDKSDVKVIYPYFSFGETPEIKLSEQEQSNMFSQYNIETKKYILSVGSLNKRKNIQMLIDAYNQIDTDVKLVIVGRKENQNFAIDNKNIIFTGYIDDEELKVVYKNALIFVFPSLYEGFGIPLIDAQSFGVPVLCSDIDVFREIGGESVEYISKDFSDLSEKLNFLLNDANRLEELKEKGLNNIIRFGKKNIQTQIKEVLKV